MRELDGRHEAVGLDMRSHPELAKPVIEASVLEAQKVTEACKGIDTVIHLAAMANIYAGSAAEIMHVNTVGTWNVLAAAESAGVRRVVLCSSDSAVGLTVRPERMKPPAYLPIDEDHPCHPTDPYGLSKLIGETIGRSFADRGDVEVVALRPVYIMYPQVVAEWRLRAKDPLAYRPPEDPASPKAGGGPFWHYVCPQDIARAFRLAAEAPAGEPFSVFHVLSDETLHPQPTLERARHLFGTLPEIRTPEVYENNPHASLFSSGRFQARYGFQPRRLDRESFFEP
jgi:nucleoside-diphosphate-sugar epimerase